MTTSLFSLVSFLVGVRWIRLLSFSYLSKYAREDPDFGRQIGEFMDEQQRLNMYAVDLQS